MSIGMYVTTSWLSDLEFARLGLRLSSLATRRQMLAIVADEDSGVHRHVGHIL